MKKLAIIMLAMGFAISVPIAAMADGGYHPWNQDTTHTALGVQNQSITYDQYAGIESIHDYTVTSSFSNNDWGITTSNFGTAPQEDSHHDHGSDPGSSFGSVGFGQFGVQGYFDSASGADYTTTDARVDTMGGAVTVADTAQVGANCAAKAGNSESLTQNQGQTFSVHLNGNTANGWGTQYLTVGGYTQVEVH